MSREHGRSHKRASGSSPWICAIGLFVVGLMMMSPAASELKRIVYIEASTVHNWKLEAFPARTRTERYRFEVLSEYDFDKSRRVNEVLSVHKPRPNAVVLQECSVYFPGDLEDYQRKFGSWVDALELRGLRPIIATVVPPAHSRSSWQDTKDFIKQRLLRRPSRYEQVIAFNEWLRALATERNMPLLDLERIVCISADDRHLRDDYNVGDGVHLTPLAYKRLDRELLNFLDRIDWSKPSH